MFTFYKFDGNLLVLTTGSSANGIPSEEEFVSTYCKLTGRGDTPINHWNYYLALSFFRMAAIAQVTKFQIL